MSKFPEEKAWSVVLFTDYGFGHESWKPLAVGVSNAEATDIQLQYEMENHPTFDDITQTGSYVSVISRNYCTNHESFEREHNWYDDDDLPLWRSYEQEH